MSIPYYLVGFLLGELKFHTKEEIEEKGVHFMGRLGQDMNSK